LIGYSPIHYLFMITLSIAMQAVALQATGLIMRAFFNGLTGDSAAAAVACSSRLHRRLH
jgi:hypothetical protein